MNSTFRRNGAILFSQIYTYRWYLSKCSFLRKAPPGLSVAGPIRFDGFQRNEYFAVNSPDITESLPSTSTRQSGRLQGLFYNAAIGRGRAASHHQECPFPQELRFGTVPEAITNDEELD